MNTDSDKKMKTSVESDDFWPKNDSLCRVCLISDEENKCIFTTDITWENRSFLKLWETLKFYGGVEVNMGDGLPSKICNNCISNIRVAHDFRMQCQKSDKQIRSIGNKFDTFKTEINTEESNETNTQATDNNCNTSGEKRLSKRLIFQRMTSMENLENCKQQRRYLRKNLIRERGDKHISEANEEPCDSIDQEEKNILNRIDCNAEVFACERCDKQFNMRIQFLEHKKCHEADKKLESTVCTICNKSFQKPITLVRHLNIHKRKNPKAVYKILKEIRYERNNKESIYGNENTELLRNHTFVSESLNAGTNTKNLDLQNDCTSGNEEMPSDDKSTIKLINTWIREELDSGHKSKSFSCHVCSKSYGRKFFLDKHTSKWHEKSKSGFETKEQKMRLDKSEEDKDEGKDKNFKRFLCHICSKTFRHNTGLMFHMRTHTGDKPYVCKFCGRGFTSSSNCINHERTHTGDRPFICHFCSAAFAKSCTLKAHLTTHTGEANYPCKTCGKSFKRLKYLKEHRFTHTGEKPYVCKICGTAYSHSGSLFVHEKKCKAQQQSDCHETTLNCDPVSIEQFDNITDENIFLNISGISVENPENFDLVPTFQCL